MNDNRKVPKLPSVKRLPSYLHELKLLRDQQQQMVSTTYLAQKLGLEPIIVRKDLELASSTGSPGVGYSVQSLIDGIENFLGWNNETPVVLIGVGNLGTALLGYRGFAEYRFNIIAAFDNDPEKVGSSVHGKPVYHVDYLHDFARNMQIEIAILSVPCEYAQKAAENIANAGLKAIWNFTNTTLNLPPDIVQQRVNMAGDLAELSVKLSGKLWND
ncbi:MAG: redox-sensing transcriptional repressor Rex [Lentisphaeria bacterium]|nr:redox-sensing transcriptional repressor Rex [Lentisphaerota bacterium]MBR7144458.1 redox-sensing transcriptional repressor Rex [Lentisphaeria bacterium]